MTQKRSPRKRNTFPAGILSPTMTKTREQKKAGVERRAATRMSPRKLARQCKTLPPRPWLARLTKLGPRPSHHHLLPKQAVNLAHPSRNHRQCSHCPHRLTAMMLITAEHRRGRCKLQRQLVLDNLCKLLINLL